MINIKKQNPFFLLCFFEFFERFGYYGFSYTAILFFMSKYGFNFTEKNAVLLFGGFASLTYVFNAIGGYVADKIFGIKKTMFLGAIFLLIGYFSLALSPFIQGISSYIYFSLACIIVGSSLFKPAPTNLISKIYTDKRKLDSVYTYFYMSINMGSLSASLLIPILATNYGYTVAYGVCSIGFGIGILNSVVSYSSIKDIDNEIGLLGVSMLKTVLIVFTFILAIVGLSVILQTNDTINYILWFGAGLIFGIFAFQIYVEKDPQSKKKILAAIILLIYAVLFFVIYQQKATSFFLFNVHHVNLNLFGYTVNPQTIPGVLNTAGIIILSPILALVYTRLGSRDLTLPFKFALGILFCGFAYGSMFLACLLNDPTAKVSMLWEVLAITIFFSSGELLISALGLSLMAKLLPERITGFAMGTWFITSAIGIKIGTTIAQAVTTGIKYDANTGFSTQVTIESFHKYQTLFGCVSLVAIIFSVIAFLIGKKLNRMIQN
ncbi:POT family proton-dependent oligopeptide transporter [Allofrancisella inopinata]|uniref:MFS transporter n=1 Tax=Allofrancisella inopinata TaxID=1085647 RepID=A0AAE6YHY4_9GAMM|nr:peptide MFS transporter [Allofrancisella inopinata]QIV96068.1 MFS transporter [Allofrancisella inopinata]TDT71728.1 POT family proton-dependent oligopeptide transporter [Allofrancisella inopinata]